MNRKKTSKDWIIHSLFIALIIFTFGYLITLVVIPFLQPEINPLSLQIFINEDSDFDRYNFPGSGTPSDPYLIENYTYQEHGLHEIYISGVSKYFIIRNNIIASHRYENGITVGNIPHSISIINNTVFGSAYLYDSEDGISIYNLSNCSIINNSIYNKRQGIRVWSCSNCSIQQNHLKNGRNIEIYESSNIKIMNNSLFFNELQSPWPMAVSIYVSNSDTLSLIQNQLFNSWIYFEDASINTVTIQNNSINGNEIAFFKNETNFLINSVKDFGQIIIVNCSIVNLQDINVSLNNFGISIYSSNLINCSSCKFSSNYAGLFLYNAKNMTIAESAFLNNHIGTRVKYSNSILFLNNTFQENDYGIYISNSDCSFINNTFIDNKYYDIQTYDY